MSLEQLFTFYNIATDICREYSTSELKRRMLTELEYE